MQSIEQSIEGTIDMPLLLKNLQKKSTKSSVFLNMMERRS